MTVNVEIPIVKYVGNGVDTVFTFSWSSQERSELVVNLNGNLVEEGVDYDLTEYDPDTGGTIVFAEPPPNTTLILLRRETPVTQQVNYVEGDPFPAETHERQLDKDTRILQEIIEGGRAFGDRVDLFALAESDRVIIQNSSGLDAQLRPWDCNESLAGVFVGAVVETGAPLNGAAAAGYPDGFVFFELDEPSGTTARIVMTTDEVLAERVVPMEVGYEGYGFAVYPETALLVWGNTSTFSDFPQSTNTEPLISPVPTGPGQYLMRFVKTTNVGIYQGIDSKDWQFGNWFDFWAPDYTDYRVNNGPRGLYVKLWQANIPRVSENTYQFSVAVDDGTGNPVVSSIVTKQITLRVISA